jgi:hypothetical protein
MRRALLLALTFSGAALLALPEVLAQSGVMSGPPQVIKGAPGGGPDRGPPDSPKLRSQDERPGLRSQDERPGLRSQDEPPGRRQAEGPDQRATWIAVVGGFDGKGQNVGVGYSGFQSTRNGAEDAALRACDGYGRGVRCREPFAVSTGCLYIVPGTRQGGVTWGRGSTRDLALQQCRRGGYRCDSKRIVGGCIGGGR